MNFNEYQEKARSTAIYPNLGENIQYPTLGLCGEAGEVVKKIMRDDNGIVSFKKRKELKKELGDVLWYIANLSVELGFNLENIAVSNIEKLQSRKERGMIQGSGDNR